jgi:hypothetical protein
VEDVVFTRSDHVGTVGCHDRHLIVEVVKNPLIDYRAFGDGCVWKKVLNPLLGLIVGIGYVASCSQC